MKSSTTVRRSLRTTAAKAGFSLVTTVMVLTLLALISIGLLSLSTVTLRSNTAMDAQAEAKANARLALMLAVGELQRQLGPDQRISASASILDSSAESSTSQGVNHPYWTGVWDAWAAGTESFGGDEPSEPRPIAGASNRGLAPAYEANRRDHFRSWLVSWSREQREMLRSARNFSLQGEAVPGADSNGVILMGRGTSGEDSPDYELVSGGLLGIRSQDTSGACPDGRYGWWIADESTKARILPDDYETGQELQKSDLIARAMSAGSAGDDSIVVFDYFFYEREMRLIYTRRSLELPVED
ncbi:MAG: hypothetical protein MK312_16130, partial [Roseibacillus sp.]|nr:hypothetical protein [Roseibacillus sp.]